MMRNFTSPIFLLGTQRSGTTLLTKILSSHPELFIQNEISVEKVFTENASKLDIIQNINNQIKLRHGIPVEDILKIQNRSFWGVKDPQLIYHINALKQFLPESKFIIIVRDGRAVVNSYMENKWGLGTNAYTGALRWSYEVKLQKEFLNISPINFFLIRFEDLIANMEVELKKLCVFLGIEFEPRMLQYFKQSPNYNKNKQNINTDKKPDLNLTKKWENKLSAHEINIIETIARKELLYFTYDIRSQPIKISKAEEFYYKLHQAIIGEIEIQYQLKSIAFKKLYNNLFNQ